jgi:putative endonuclease
MYFVYLLQCEDESIYTGITNDLQRRFWQHKTKKGGHYTSAHGAAEIIHTEEFKTRSEALRREAEIKKMPRRHKLALVKGD